MLLPQKPFAEDFLEFFGEGLFCFEEAYQGTDNIGIVGLHVLYYLLVSQRQNENQSLT